MAQSSKAQPAPAEPDESTAAEPEESTVDESLPFISAGVASDLEQRGWAGDPATGGMFRKDAKTGKITYTPRS